MPDPSPTTDRRDAAAVTTRRTYLRAAGALGAVSLTGSALVEETPDQVGTAPDSREDFLWVYGHLLENDRLRTNLFAFARRHDLAVVVQIRSANFESDEALFRRALAHATDVGLDVWLRVGMLTDVTAEAFVGDADARGGHLDRLRGVCRVYDELTDGGQVILWEEAPVFGQWVEGGEWNQAAVDNLVEHGARIFDEQQRVVREATTDRDVGIFVHFPYVVDSKSPAVFRTLTDRIADRDASPDFAFTDFYRGWYEKDAGPEAADDAVRSLIENARAALDDRPVFYLAQAHTVNPNHTPSRQSLRSNLRASVDAGADGLGWYARANYVPTERGFDPFVPNAPDAEFDDTPTTDTVARDRFLYAWLSTLATRPGFDPADRFDLWLRADDLSFHGHRLRAKASDGWTYLADVDGYVDGDYPYAGGGADGDVSVVRGLRRDRWLTGGALDLRIETGSAGRETTLRGAYVVPCDPDAYVAEHEAASLFAADAPVGQFALGGADEPLALVPGEARELRVPVDRADPPSLHGLRHPDSLDAIRQLQRLERRNGFDPRDRFDLWLSGDGLADPAAAAAIRGRDGGTHSPADASVVETGTDSAALYYGLERERSLGDGELSLARWSGGGATVERAYAMPHAGSATFRTASRAATLLADQPGEVATYSIDAVDRR